MKRNVFIGMVKKLLFLLLELVILTLFFFNVATLLPIPYLGSIANHYTVPYVRYWLPSLLVLFVISAVISYRHRHSKWHTLNAWVAFASFLIGAFIIIDLQTHINQLGAKTSFLKSYQPETTAGVAVEVATYDHSDLGELKLNVYQVPDGKKNKPVLVYIHGGGWVAGSRHSHGYYWKSFAKDGYVVVSLDYHLSSRKRHLSYLTEQELCRGFAWLQDHISTYGGNPNQLVVTGVSAGGNLALELAYKINSGQFEKSQGVLLPKVKAVSVLYPVASPRTFYLNNDPVKDHISKAMALAYLGGTPDQLPGQYAELTPQNAVSKQTPPTLFLSGQRDTLVPQEATYELATYLSQHDIPNKLVIFPFTNHAFDRIDGNLGSQAYLNLTKDWFSQYLYP
ncbi:alpha/beta hydrolase [Streptococcus halichoeri]|uniref:alpha/beta hydrolase n=1 Tax=Streptococcus halichoeri TaxID=254785 RepID=UPI001F285E6A|nr:alpha/beta hydrolase [Streptococcus halichoeri]